MIIKIVKAGAISNAIRSTKLNQGRRERMELYKYAKRRSPSIPTQASRSWNSSLEIKNSSNHLKNNLSRLFFFMWNSGYFLIYLEAAFFVWAL